MAAGDFASAEPLLAQALEYNPGHILSIASLGNSAFQAGDFERALKHYNQLLAITPRMEEVLMNKAAALYRMARFEEAMATLKQVKESITTDRYDQLNQAIQAAMREQRQKATS